MGEAALDQFAASAYRFAPVPDFSAPAWRDGFPGRLVAAPAKIAIGRLGLGVRVFQTMPSSAFNGRAHACGRRTHGRLARTTNLLESAAASRDGDSDIIPMRRRDGSVPLMSTPVRDRRVAPVCASTEFELRQIAAVRKDLDNDHQTGIMPRAAPFQAPIASKSSLDLDLGRYGN